MARKSRLFQPKTQPGLYDFAETTRNPALQSQASEFQKGLQRSGVGSMDYLQAAYYDAVGDEAARQQKVQDAQRSIRTAQQRFPAEVSSFRDVDNVGDAFDYVAGGAGESVPLMTTAIAGGAGGRGLSKLFGAGRRGKQAAQTTGAVSAIAAPETGFSYAETEEAGNPNPYTALGGGVAKAGLDVFSLGRNLRTFKPSQGGQSVRKAVDSTGRASAREAATESAQESIDIGIGRHASGEDVIAPLSTEEFDRMANAGILGGAIGGMTAGAGNVSQTAAPAVSKAVSGTAKQVDRALGKGMEAYDRFRSKGRAKDVLNDIEGKNTVDTMEGIDEELGGEGVVNPDEVADGFQESSQYGTRSQIFNSQNEPWPSAALKEIAGFEATDSTGRQMNKVLASDPVVRTEVQRMREEGATEQEVQDYLDRESPYTRKPYVEHVIEKARQENADFTQMAEQEAARLLDKNPSLREATQGMKATEILNQFEYIEREDVPDALNPSMMDELSLSDTEAKSIVRKPKFEKGKGKTTRPGEVPIRVKGKDGQWQDRVVDAHQLVSTMLRKMPPSNEPMADRVASALYSGLTSLSGVPGVQEVDLSAFDPSNSARDADVVVFNQRRSGQPTRKFTLAELEGRQTPKIEQDAATKKYQRVAKEAREAQVKLQKARKRLNDIPFEMVEAYQDMERFNQLEVEYLDTRKQLPALEKNVQKKEQELRKAAEERDEAQAKAGDLTSFDPDDVQEISGEGIDAGVIEGAAKKPIERGYSSSDSPGREGLFNHNITDEHYEKNLSKADAETRVERLFQYIGSLRNTIKVLANDGAAYSELESAYFTLNKKAESLPENVTPETLRKQLLKTANERLSWANEKLANEKDAARVSAAKGVVDEYGSLYETEGVARPHDMPDAARSAVPEQLETIINGMADKAGVEYTAISFDEALTKQIQRGNIHIAERMAGGSVLGFFDHTDRTMFVQPGLVNDPKKARIIISHELGHAVEKQFLQDAPGSVVEEIFEEHLQHVKKVYGGPIEVQFRRAFKNRPDELRGLMMHALDPTNPSGWNAATRANYIEHASYVDSFAEWFADSAAKRLRSRAKPKSNFERLLDRMLKALRKLLNVEQPPYNTVEEFVDALMYKNEIRWGPAIDPMSIMDTGDPAVNVDLSESAQPGEGASSAAYRRAREFIERTTGRKADGFTERLAARMAHMQNADVMGAAFNESFRYALKGLFTKADREAAIKAADSAHVRSQLRNLFRNHPEQWGEISNDPEALVAYAYQFWVSGDIDLGPRTRNIFQKFYDFLRDLFGYIAEDEQVEQIFEQFTTGEALTNQAQGNTSPLVKSVVRDTRMKRAVQDTIAPAWDKFTDNKLWNAVFTTASSRMHKTDNPILKSLANMIYNPVGTVGVSEDMITARTEHIGRFTDMVYEQFKDKSAEHGKAVIDLLNKGEKLDKNSTNEVVQDALAVRRLLDGIYLYMQEAGMKVGYIENYFPWVFDKDYMMQHYEEFVQLLQSENFREFVPDETGARAIASAIMQQGGLADNHIDTEAVGHVPAMSAFNERSLRWIDEAATPEQRAEFAKFFSEDLGHTMMTYIEQAVKRTEYYKRFGEGKLEKMLNDAAFYGAKPQDIEAATTFIDAAMGTQGYKTNQWLHKVLGMEPPPPGQVINPKLQRAFGVAMVYQNLRVLSLATLTSLADVVGVAVRTGDVSMSFGAMKTGFREAYKNAKGQKSELADLAEMLGTIDRKMTAEALGWEYGGVYLTGTERRINETFFRAIGLNAWTRATRIIGLEAGTRFLKKHAQNPNEHSQRFLEELNLVAEDVLIDSEGNLRVLESRERLALRTMRELMHADQLVEADQARLNSAMQTLEGVYGDQVHQWSSEIAGEELSRDNRVRNALNRFVDGAVLRPNAMLRPLWASDPHWMLVFHLKSFTYAFHERIVKRIVHETGQNNLVPLMSAMMFIPVMLASDMLRDMIQHGGDEDPRKVNWDWSDHVAHSAERSGLYGLLQVPLDAAQDVKMGGLGHNTYSGPTWQQVEDILTSEDYEPIEAVPGQNVIKYWTEQ